VPTLNEGLAHRPTGDVGVEQDPHSRLAAGPRGRTLPVCRWGRDHGRRDLVPLLRLARVLFERLLYLARVRLIVGEGEV
jgi:hypothetical protein